MIISNLEELATAMQMVQTAELLAYDTETTSLNVRKCQVIGLSVSNGLDAFYLPILTWDGTALRSTGLDPKPMLTLLASKKLVMWNAAYDVQVTQNNLGVDLLPALHADALLMKHTCDEEFPFGLKEVAAKIFGTEVKSEKEELKTVLKEAGAKAGEFYKAPVSVLGRYACQDALLTMRLFNHYNRELRRLGLEEFYFEREVLPLYKEVTIPMVKRGIAVNVPLLQQAAAEVDANLAMLEQKIQEAITPNLAIFKSWFLNKDYPLRTTTGLLPKWAKEGLTQEQAWRRDQPTGYMFNLHSKFHLKKLFFDTLGLEPLSKTPTGMPQVDDEFISSLHEQYPWTKLLTDYNKLTKISGTYINRLLEEQEDGRFYPEWKQHGTVSGRFSGDMQQLPRPIDAGAASELIIKHNNRIREFIIADSGALLCSADYEQLEPTIFSHCSNDALLQQVFKSGADFYSTVAIATEGLTGVSADKAAPNYLGKVNKAARQKAKAYALGIAYGMTDYKLQFEIGVSKDEATTLVNRYLSAYPDLANWMAASKSMATTQGYVATQSGRRRNLKQAVALANKYGPSLADSLELWKRYNGVPSVYSQAKADRKTYINLLNNAINFQVQGLAASIVNRAAIAIARKLKTEGHKSYIVAQIHDEIVLNVPKNEIEPVGALVQSIMQNIVELSVPLRTVPQFGACFKDCK